MKYFKLVCFILKSVDVVTLAVFLITAITTIVGCIAIKLPLSASLYKCPGVRNQSFSNRNQYVLHRSIESFFSYPIVALKLGLLICAILNRWQVTLLERNVADGNASI